MKKVFLLILVSALARPMGAAVSNDSGPLQKVAVMVVGNDPKVVRDTELEVRALLAGRQVESASYETLFPSEKTWKPSEIQNQLKKELFDSILVLRTQRNIRMPSRKTPASFEDFLKSQAVPQAPGAEPILIEPVKGETYVETMPRAPGRQPIPGSSGQTGYQMMKVGMSVYRTSTGHLQWHNTVPVKIPHDLPTSKVQKLIAKRCVEEAASAGLLPAR